MILSSGRTALNHVQAVIAELQSSLDPARGGEVADHLNLFYNVARGLAFDANTDGSPKPVEQLLAQFRSMLVAWRKVENSVSGPTEQPGTPEPLPAVSSPVEAPKSTSARFESNHADTDPATSSWSA